MLHRLEDFGGSGKRLVFAHANGYPAGSYRQLFLALNSVCNIAGYHSRPLWSPELPPARLNWHGFADDLIETLQATQDEPVWMMGHSMGAVIATIAAAQQPELFRGLILIDPVFVKTRYVLGSKLTPLKTLDKRPMVRRTLSRPNRFASQQEAFDFYRPKRAFGRFSEAVLWDYVRASTRPHEDGELELAYAREWEAAAYRSTPFVWNLIHKIRLPVLGLRGETSETLSPDAFKRWGRLQPQADLRECKGGHLLPLEYPQATAAQIIDFLRGQGS